MPMGDDPAVSAFTWLNWDEGAFNKTCWEKYQIIPQYDWALDYFGGRAPSSDFKDVTNLILSNG
jgi:hypothetical protein